MNNVAEIIKLKGNDVFTISPNITVFDALKILSEKNIGALIVTKNDKIVGIFSERDYARKIILKGKSSIVTTVSELMTTDVLYVSPADSIDDCIDLMSDNHIRHLPVLEEEKLVAIISIGDVVKHIIKHQKFQIRELEKYIKGGYRL